MNDVLITHACLIGPKGPFTNAPPQIERQVEFVAAAIEDAEKAGGKTPVEATHEAERAYSELCDRIASTSLFWKAEVREEEIPHEVEFFG